MAPTPPCALDRPRPLPHMPLARAAQCPLLLPPAPTHLPTHPHIMPKQDHPHNYCVLPGYFPADYHLSEEKADLHHMLMLELLGETQVRTALRAGTRVHMHRHAFAQVCM